MAKPSSLRFRPDVQGMRAIAVALVVVFHSGLAFDGGFLGVDVFFVISGFVIGRLLVRDLTGTGRIDLGDFYSRRVRRILPALCAVLVFVAIGSVVFIGPASDLPDLVVKVGLASALFSANIALTVFSDQSYFALSSDANPLLHMWTLGVEEQFYLFFPLFLIVVGRLARRRGHDVTRTLIVACVAAALVSFVAGVYLASASGFPLGSLADNRQLAFYASPIRAWEFLIGVLVVFFERSGRLVPERVARLVGVVGLVAIVWPAWVVTGETPTPGWIALVPVLGVAALIVVGTSTRGGVTALLSTRPMAWVGDRSYGWYLWHWPLIVFTRLSVPSAPAWVLLVAGIAALVPTELSYRIIEQPIRLDKSWRGRRALRLAAICCGLPIVVFIAGSVATDRLSSRLALAGNPTRTHLDHAKGCSRLDPTDPAVAQRCTWRVENAKGRIVLIGDSNAGALSDVMRSRVVAAGYDFTLATYDACRFGAVAITTFDSDCSRWVKAWTDHLADNPVSLVVISNRTSSTIHLATMKLLDPTTGRHTGDEAAKARIWERGLAETVGAISAGGSPVAVIATVPQFDRFDVRLCPTWRLVLDPSGCAATRTRRSAEDYRRVSLGAERRAVARVARAHVVDFTDDLCPDGRCSTFRDGVWIYRDDSHLTIPGSMTLSDAIDTKVIALADPMVSKSG